MTENTTASGAADDLHPVFTRVLPDLPDTKPFTLFKAGFRQALVTMASAPVAPAPQPAPVKIVRDFRWDSAQQHHVPTLLLEFEPVPANSPIDAKGWNDRDDVAIMLAASFRCAP